MTDVGTDPTMDALTEAVTLGRSGETVLAREIRGLSDGATSSRSGHGDLRRTISAIQTGAYGEVQPGEVG